MITLNAYAKLNLALDVTGKRSDGYHELDMIMQSISLCDTVHIQKKSGISVRMDAGDVDEQTNTAYIAASVFCAHTRCEGAHIFIEKRIPSMAGLGGSSADAAAVLIGLDKLYETQLDADSLASMGKAIGADVPFALLGGTARAQGIGEKLKRFTLGNAMYFVLVKPYQGVPTAKAFGAYQKGTPLRMDSVQFALAKGDIHLYHEYTDNALGMAALSLAPNIMHAANALMKAGAAKAMMSGSGSTMFAVFETMGKAQAAARKITGDFELVGAYSSQESGVQIIGETNE